MNRKRAFFTFALSVTFVGYHTCFAQNLSKPRLVVGLVVDQMRWDYLYRYQQRWQKQGGFNKLLQEGFVCDNTNLNYVPTFTASGHASIYTGSVPAINGITGNNWWDIQKQSYVYCTSDDKVTTVGSKTDAGHMSPINLLTNSICDELKLATNFRSKTIGIALKDRGAILAVGRSADAAYWYDEDEGEWISSTYYQSDLPEWAKQLHTKAKVDSLYSKDWYTLYDKASYNQSEAEAKAYKVRTFGVSAKELPYNLKKFVGNNYGMIAYTPAGNTLTTDFAKAAILGEHLGADSITDFLAISYSSTDYIGHAYGPNSMEMEDTYLRLDLELGNFFDFLDKQIGKDNYLVFLTADHGVGQVPGFLKDHKLPADNVDEKKMNEQLNEALKQQFGVEGLSKTIMNFQVVLNKQVIEKSKKIRLDDIIDFAIGWLQNQDLISRAIRLDAAAKSTLPELYKTQIANGYYPNRSGDIQILYKPGVIEGFETGGTTHGGGYANDTHVPLLWYGWKIPKGGTTQRHIAITDIAPTLAALLHIQEPNGSIGSVITELFEKK